MYLINETYFVDEVPNTQELQGNENNALGRLIDEKVRLFLQEHLGRVNFLSLDSDIDAEGNLKDDAALRWKDLVYGCEYTIAGSVYNWRGLLEFYGTTKKSLLVAYVYPFWIRANVSYMTGVGEVRAEAKNAVSVNSTQRLVHYQNEFVEAYQGNCNNYFDGFYRAPVFYDYYQGGTGSNYVTMIQFLSHNSETYPDCNLRTYEFSNQLGL